MTPAERRHRFRAEVRRQAAQRGLAVEAGVLDLLGTLAELREDLTQRLGRNPSAFEMGRMGELLAEVDRALAIWQDRALGRLRSHLEQAWERGPKVVTEPLAAVRIEIGRTMLPHSLLDELTSYAADKLQGVTPLARQRIEREIRLTVLGGKSPHEAMVAVQDTLHKPGTFRFVDFRTETIVRTEIGKVHSQAGDRRLRDAAKKVSGLKKQWLWSGKSRVMHQQIDEQVREVDQPYTLPDEVEMQYPRAPGAPVEHVANCGCESVPYKDDW